jgi:hypothetical protein
MCRQVGKEYAASTSRAGRLGPAAHIVMALNAAGLQISPLLILPLLLLA